MMPKNVYLVDAIALGVHQATANVVSWRIGDHLCAIDGVDAVPEVPHVECMSDPFHGRPVGSEAILLVADLTENFVDHLHRGGGEVTSQWIIGCKWQHLFFCAAIEVDSGNVVPRGCTGVEHLQPLDVHGVHGVSNCFVQVIGESISLIELFAAQ